jgi:serine/threonine protein kinase/Tol biopolymer transport system component
MGEVYRAKDTRLGRDVAVKVLPERLLEDSDALARFEREAKAVAALSHPNILALHDVGREGRVAYAVMELLEGETLRQELASGPLSTRRAVDYGVQIAHGLAAAHEKGIVHRDLKPDNVFVTRDDRVKILDFGLAKPGAGTVSGSETESPTVSGYTEPGKVMGTVGYMSPEQVRGVTADARSDIFSFGSMLYEMLTGRRAFQGETAAETMTAILRDEPADLAESGRAVPLSLAPVVRHCLEKKPEKRFQSARDLAFALETASAPSASSPVVAIPSGVSAPSAVRRPVWKWLGVAALVAAAAIVGYFLHPRNVVSSGPDWNDMTLNALTTDPGYEGEPTFSPDGHTIAYVSDREGNFEIYLQQIDGGPAINLTKNPAADIQPAFSPDGRQIAFVSNRSGTSDIFHAAPGLPVVGGEIWVMPALGGPARRIVEGGNFPSWTPDGSALLYVHGTFRNTRIARVPASGGEGRDLPIEDLYVARYFYPRLSDDGRWLLYQNGNRVEVVAAAGGKGKMLAVGQYPAWGAGSTTILYTNGTPGKGRSLWRASFSLARGELSGDPQPLTFGRGSDVGASASRDGRSIAFAALDESLDLEMVPFDAEAGRVTGAPTELTPGNNQVRFFDPSPDGKAVVFAAERGEASDLFRVDPPALPVELTRDAKYSDNGPVWSPDGKQIAFWRTPAGNADPGGALWIMNADGTNPRRVMTEFSGEALWLSDRSLLVEQGEKVVRLDIASGAAEPFAAPKMRTMLSVDPMRQWLAYQPVDARSMKLFAMPIAGGQGSPVDTGSFDAYHPFFSPSNRWLYFQPAHKNLYRVPGPAQHWAKAEPEKVTDFSGIDLYIDDPKISLDGTKLFYTQGRRTGDIVILRFGNGAEKKPKS